jgi:hypothetical protein
MPNNLNSNFLFPAHILLTHGQRQIQPRHLTYGRINVKVSTRSQGGRKGSSAEINSSTAPAVLLHLLRPRPEDLQVIYKTQHEIICVENIEYIELHQHV